MQCKTNRPKYSDLRDAFTRSLRRARYRRWQYSVERARLREERLEDHAEIDGFLDRVGIQLSYEGIIALQDILHEELSIRESRSS